MPNSNAVAASYARYSTEMQQTASVDDQQRKLRERAGRMGMEIAAELEFADHAVSGTLLQRPGLDALREAAGERRFNVLFVETLSRLGRGEVMTLGVVQELVEMHGIRIISVDEGVDTVVKGWELQAGVNCLMAGKTVRDIRDQVLRGQEGNILADRSVGDLCFGYGSRPVGGDDPGRHRGGVRPKRDYHIIPEQAAVVLRIFDEFARDRRSMGAIARRLTAERVPNVRGRPNWLHSTVRGILANRKYVGEWAWGRTVTRRNPATGAVRREPRPPEEAARWARSRPRLRIVPDDLWEAAQARLAEIGAGHVRGGRGRLRGSRKGGAAGPRHLLQGLVRCAECGANATVCGTDAGYLGCWRRKSGGCPNRTMFRRAEAERRVLEAVCRRLSADPGWVAWVAAHAREAHRRRYAAAPGELARLRAEAADLDAKIARLVDRVEDGEPDPALTARLRERRAERQRVAARLERLGRDAAGIPPEPTDEWVRAALADVGRLLEVGGLPAREPLRTLVGGAIAFERVGVPGRRRCRSRLRFRMTVPSAVAAAAPALGGPAAGDGTADGGADGGEIVLDLTAERPRPWAAYADRVKELWDAGVEGREIARRLGIRFPWVAKARRAWHEARGEACPDGRACMKRLPPATLAHRLADAVEPLLLQGLSYRAIAERLGCGRNQVAKAVALLAERDGRPRPDGRARRRRVPPGPEEGDGRRGGGEPAGGSAPAGSSAPPIGCV